MAYTLLMKKPVQGGKMSDLFSGTYQLKQNERLKAFFNPPYLFMLHYGSNKMIPIKTVWYSRKVLISKYSGKYWGEIIATLSKAIF